MFATTTAEVYHLETDNENHRNILHTDYSAIKTTDGQSIATIAGNSLKWVYKKGVGDEVAFTAITGLAQISLNCVITAEGE